MVYFCSYGTVNDVMRARKMPYGPIWQHISEMLYVVLRTIVYTECAR